MAESNPDCDYLLVRFQSIFCMAAKLDFSQRILQTLNGWMHDWILEFGMGTGKYRLFVSIEFLNSLVEREVVSDCFVVCNCQYGVCFIN